MSEVLTQRVKRLISGSANVIVTAMEDAAPEMVMEEAIREVDTAIEDIRAELGQVLTRQYHASQRIAAENQRHEELVERIRIALKEKRDDLAESGVESLLDIEAQIPLLEAVLTETREAQEELENYITALQARRREMQDELNAFRAANDSLASQVKTPAGAGGANQIHRRVDKASQSFERVMERAGGFRRSGSTTDRKTAAMTAELEELARRNRVSERLAALRERE